MKQSELSDMLFKAEQAQQTGDWAEARQLYEKILATQPHHPEAQRQLGKLDRLETVDADVLEMIEDGDARLQKGDFKGALGVYTQALAQAAHVGILKYSAKLEQKRNQARELVDWLRQAREARQEAQQSKLRDELEAARTPLVDLMQKLPEGPFYDDMAAQLRQELHKIEGQLDADRLYQQAYEAFEGQDFEQAIRLAEAIPSDSPKWTDAQGLLDRVRGVLRTYVQEPLGRAEEAFEQGRWDDAFAELDNLRKQFPSSPIWQRLWLRVGQAHGQQELDRGRQANSEREFESARRCFARAGEAFEKVQEVYPTHTTVRALHAEARDLIEVSIQEIQAQGDWKAGRRQDALAALKQAQSRIEHAGTEGRDYVAVSTLVKVMRQRLDEEIERIQEEDRRLQDGERLLGGQRFDEAVECFRQTMNALLLKHRQQAAKSLDQAEREIQGFDAMVAEGQETDDPHAVVRAFQTAYEQWPTGPGALTQLEHALGKAGAAARKAGRERESIAYYQRGLELNPKNRQFKIAIQEFALTPQIEADLEQIREKWKQLIEQADLAANAFDPLLDTLEQRRQETEKEHPKLHKQVDALYQDIVAQRRQWQDYETTYRQAQKSRQAGEWDEAVEQFGQALAALGEGAFSALRERLTDWQRARDALREAQENVPKQFQQAKSAYAQALEQGDFDASLTALDQAERIIESSEEDVRRAGGQEGSLATQRSQVQDLRQRVEIARDAYAAPAASDGLLIVRPALQKWPDDATLQALEQNLKTRAEGEVDVLMQRAEVALDALNLSEALSWLSRAYDLQPENPEIATRYSQLQRRDKLENQLRQAETDCASKLSTESPVDARDALRGGLNALLGTESGLPQEAEEILGELMRLDGLEDGLALGHDEHWQKAQDSLTQLGRLGSLHWTARRAVSLADQWARLARDIALQGITASEAQLGNMLGAYEATVALLRTKPTDEQAIEGEARIREQLINQLNASVSKRLGRAESALSKGDFVIALGNLDSIESEFYKPIEEKFPGLMTLDPEGMLEQQLNDLQDMQQKARRLQALHADIQPQLEQARQALLKGKLESAREALIALPTLKDAPNLIREVNDLQASIKQARLEQARKALREAGTRAQGKLRLASRREDVEQILQELETLPAEVDLDILPQDERERYYRVLDEVREQKESLVSGGAFEQQAEQAREDGDYVAEARALERAKIVTRQGDKLAVLEHRLAVIESLAKEQLEREDTLKRGQTALNAQEYGRALVELRQAQGMGAEVDDLLRAAEAGDLLERAQRAWKDEQDWEGAQLDLEDLLNLLAEGNPQIEDEMYQHEAPWSLQTMLSLLAMVDRHCQGHEKTVATQARRFLRHLVPKIRQLEKDRQDREKETETRIARANELNQALVEARSALGRADLENAQEHVRIALGVELDNKQALELQIQITNQLQARALGQARAALNAGNLQDAQQCVQTVLEQNPQHQDAVELQDQIERRLKAQTLLAQAQEARAQARYKDAQALVGTILSDVLPDYPEAKALQEQLKSEREAGRLLLQAETLARNDEFKQARQALRQAVERGAAPDQVRPVQDEIEEREAKWERETIKPIRDLLLEREYAEALSRCQQALSRAADDFQATLQNLQTEIVNKWAERDLGDLKKCFQEAEDEEKLSAIITALEQLANLNPESHLSEIERLRGQVQERRLERRLALAVERVEERQWQAARKLLSAILQEAEELGMGGIAFQATRLEMDIEQKQRKDKDTENRKEFTRLLEQAQAWKEVSDRAKLETVLSRAKQALEVEGFEQDYTARNLCDEIQQALDRYDASKAAIEESVRLVREGDFERAGVALSIQVSELWRQEYESQRALVELLRQAERHQKRDEWAAALNNYRQVIEQEESLEPVLATDVNRCHERLMEDVVQNVEQALESAPPDIERARERLDEAEEQGWIAEVDRARVEGLRQWIRSQESVAQAAQLLQEQGDPAEAKRLLRQARGLLPSSQSDQLIQQWENLTQAILDWRKGNLDAAEQALQTLLPTLDRLPYVRQLKGALADAIEVVEILDRADAQVSMALGASPPEHLQAVNAVLEALQKQKVSDDPRAGEFRKSVQARLRALLEGARQTDRYAEALDIAASMVRLDPADAEVGRLPHELADERRNKLSDELHKADEALGADELDKVQSALSRAAIISAPERPQTLKDLEQRLNERRQTLQEVRDWLERAETSSRRSQWQEAVDHLLLARQEAPRYLLVVEAVKQCRKDLTAEVQSSLKREQFSQALDLVEQALRLGSQDDLLALQKKVRDSRDDRLAEYRQRAEYALEGWDLDVAAEAIQHGLAIAMDDDALLRLRARAKSGKDARNDLQEEMVSGWRALRRRDYGAAYQAFDRALELAPQFQEAQSWRDYTRNMEQAIQQAAPEARAFQQSVELLESAEGLLRIGRGQRLPAILDASNLRQGRREAAYDAHRLGKIAQRLADLDSQYNRQLRQGDKRKALETLDSLTATQEHFSQQHQAHQAPPDDFSIDGAPVSTRPATPEPIFEPAAPAIPERRPAIEEPVKDVAPQSDRPTAQASEDEIAVTTPQPAPAARSELERQAVSAPKPRMRSEPVSEPRTPIESRPEPDAKPSPKARTKDVPATEEVEDKAPLTRLTHSEHQDAGVSKPRTRSESIPDSHTPPRSRPESEAEPPSKSHPETEQAAKPPPEAEDDEPILMNWSSQSSDFALYEYDDEE